MTAWLARLGVAVGGNTLAGLRWPFLLLGAALPWLVVRMAAAVGGSRAGWQAGGLALLMPLSAGLGLLAVPDVPLVVASVACLQATVALLQRITPARLAWLAVGLVAGAPEPLPVPRLPGGLAGRAGLAAGRRGPAA